MFSHPAGFPPPPNFLIPHSLSLDQDKGLLFVADRENGRVLTFDTQTGHYRDVYKGFGEKVFAISYSPLQGTFIANSCSQATSFGSIGGP